MSRCLSALAALLLLSAPAARAQEEGVPEEAPLQLPPRDWSFGAGVALPGWGVPVGPALWALSAPVVEGSVEKRVGQGLWLVANLGTSFSATTAPSTSSGLPVTEAGGQESRSASVRAGLGLRAWLTPADAPVVLSVAGVLSTEYSRSFSQGAYVLGDGSVQSFASSGWNARVGFSGSVAGEHFFTPQLALRVRMQVLDVGYFAGRGLGFGWVPSFPGPGQPGTVSARPPPTTGFSGGLMLSPALDLRLFF